MAITHLPQNPDLDQLRSQAREHQRADGTTLHEAQLSLARSYGFASWARLKHQVEAINARSWNYSEPAGNTSPSERFLRAACLNYADDNHALDAVSRVAEAQQLLAGQPDLPSGDVAVAAVCADTTALRSLIDADPTRAAKPTSPYGWSPLMYLAYGRVPTDRQATLACARVLLDAGADPDDGRFFSGFAIPFTVITGVFGGGEQNQTGHQHATSLATLLLDRGAEPNDGQTLYNRMFSPDDTAFALLFDHGLGRGPGGAWHRLIPDLLRPPAAMVGDLLEWAVTHDQRDRVALLARHGVDVTRPLARGKTPLHLALVNGYAELAQQLRRLGASEPVLTPVERFIAAALSADAAAVTGTAGETVAKAKARRPGLIVWATSLNRSAAVELLVAAGFDVNALGRADIPVEQEWQTALHTAVEMDNAVLLRRLLELGADRTIRDRRFNGTPLDWANHLGRPAMAALVPA